MAGKLKVTFLSRDANSIFDDLFVCATMHSVTSFLGLINWKINESINENYRAFASEEGRFFLFFILAARNITRKLLISSALVEIKDLSLSEEGFDSFSR